jgi:hypothetical protein
LDLWEELEEAAKLLKVEKDGLLLATLPKSTLLLLSSNLPQLGFRRPK